MFKPLVEAKVAFGQGASKNAKRRMRRAALKSAALNTSASNSLTTSPVGIGPADGPNDGSVLDQPELKLSLSDTPIDQKSEELVHGPEEEQTGWSMTEAKEQKAPMPTPPTTAPNPVVNQPIDDIFQMCQTQRRELLQGPQITIHMGTTTISKISKRFAMAASPILNAHFTSHPTSLTFTIANNYLAPHAVKALLKTWPEHGVNRFQTPDFMVTNTVDDIPILRAAYLLGMQRYTRTMRLRWVKYLKRSLPTYEEIDAVMACSSGEMDPLRWNMVNRLVHLRYTGRIPDGEVFERFVGERPVLRADMERADLFFKNKALKEGGEGA
ncbi:hypothetical protein P280DRAFT_169800 [Massarina eburnea CBS 473.64]|uniref:Uncharacterized protein n=1 Tax=Massarina eburnea CBS 473.64 TaxID=1395130 RepID=A0A6A6RL75_9PLEO|nr:hypothetical protein P280DRAFT_169800 [Massarina eburnea CBS 473.64]